MVWIQIDRSTRARWLKLDIAATSERWMPIACLRSLYSLSSLIYFVTVNKRSWTIPRPDPQSGNHHLDAGYVSQSSWRSGSMDLIDCVGPPWRVWVRKSQSSCQWGADFHRKPCRACRKNHDQAGLSNSLFPRLGEITVNVGDDVPIKVEEHIERLTPTLTRVSSLLAFSFSLHVLARLWPYHLFRSLKMTFEIWVTVFWYGNRSYRLIEITHWTLINYQRCTAIALEFMYGLSVARKVT